VESVWALAFLIFFGAMVLRALAPSSTKRPTRQRRPEPLGHEMARNDVADYRPKGSLFTDAEARFLRVLDEALGDDHRVFAKVRVADLLTVGRVADNSSWQRAFNQISAKHVDFVVCARDTLHIVAAVELDDRSHDAPDRQRRDAFLERAFARADVRLARVPVRAAYEPAEVRELVLGHAVAASPAIATEVGATVEAAGVRRCHACGSPMERRSAQRGAEGFQEFYVCTNAPRCRVRYASRDASA
jgi:hypothetical protein